MMKRISDRDLLVFIVACIAASAIGVIDTIIDIRPEVDDGIITAGLVLGAFMTFYFVGKSGKNGD